MHKKIAQELLDESTRIVENIEGMDYLSYTFSDINRINIQDDIKNIYIKESELPSESDYTIHQRTLLFSEALEDFSQQMVNKKNREKIIRLYLHFVERLVLSQDNSMIMNNLIADQMQQIFEGKDYHTTLDIESIDYVFPVLSKMLNNRKIKIMRLLKLQKSTSNDIISLFDPQKKEQKELELNQQDKNLLVQYQDEIGKIILLIHVLNYAEFIRHKQENPQKIDITQPPRKNFPSELYEYSDN